MMYKSIFREFPVNTEIILRKIKEQDEICGMYHLAKELKMDKGDLCRCIHFLKDIGFVNVTKKSDKRYAVISITSNGIELLNIIDSIEKIISNELGE